MNDRLKTDWHATRAKCIEAGGNVTQSFGFGRVLGQAYTLLYLSTKPLCLDEIVKELGVSKASVSTTVRQLENWSAIKPVWVKGDRKDYYEAATDFRTVLREGVLARLRRKLDSAGLHLEQAEQSLHSAMDDGSDEERKEIEVVTERLQRAKQFHSKINALLSDPLIDHLL